MSKLSDFCVASYSQGDQLTRQYQHNKELWGGVCYSLMCEWFKLVKAGGSTGSERMAKLEEQLKLCGSRQRIYTEVFNSLAKEENVTWSSVATAMTKHGHLFGVQFDYKGLTEGGSGVIKDYVSDNSRKDKFFYLSIKFKTGGGHAIGIYTSNPILVYDPNYGEHEINSGKRGSFFTALWSAYSGLNGGIKTAIIFGMEAQESIFSFWKKKTGST